MSDRPLRFPSHGPARGGRVVPGYVEEITEQIGEKDLPSLVHSVREDFKIGRAYLGLTSPTDGQRLAVEKAIIRMLRILLRES